jgi:hypothetical protein
MIEYFCGETNEAYNLPFLCDNTDAIIEQFTVYTQSLRIFSSEVNYPDVEAGAFIFEVLSLPYPIMIWIVLIFRSRITVRILTSLIS